MKQRLLCSAVLMASLSVAATTSADAAMAKIALFACKEDASIAAWWKLRSQGGVKASTPFEDTKISSGECVVMPKNVIVSIDARKPGLFCVRPPGGLDCYWSIALAVDEYATKPKEPPSPPASSGSQNGGGPGGHGPGGRPH